LIKNKKNVEK